MLDRFRVVFESFQKHDVRYVVIGGIAAILHGVPRATLVLDVLIEATPQNARNLWTTSGFSIWSATMAPADRRARGPYRHPPDDWSLGLAALSSP